MNKDIFTLSERGRSGEYTCSIVRVGELKPIEGSDFLALAEADGEGVVVRKDEVKPGDIMVYARIETTLNEHFLSANNLYGPECYELNKNAKEYEKIFGEVGKEEARRLCGYFGKSGRVRIARLKGQPSKGFLFGKEALVKWNPKLADINLEDYLEIPFWDTIYGETFVQMYLPMVPEKRASRTSNAQKRLKRFDRIIPEYFAYHYDTGQLTKLINDLTPRDVVSISLKIHGTSFIMGNILTRNPKEETGLGLVFKKIWEKKNRDLKRTIQTSRSYSDRAKAREKLEKVQARKKESWTLGYNDIYSSRTKIKNQFVNPKGGTGFYETDVWGVYYDLLKGKLEKGVTIYGEIFGFEDGTNKMIQKGYDYGCKPGTSKLMIYRVVIQDPKTGKKEELDIPQVYQWTKGLVKVYPELREKIHPIDIFYHGTLLEKYPDLDPKSGTWNKEVLDCLKNDFGLEELEPMCLTKVPREGVVVRVSGDPRFCAKLKSNAFLFREAKAMDKGEVDIEMREQA